ncbi:MAG TPA: hypothetical protein VMF29_00690 [Candidatus Edwardsbacteria bacterium]|nr:hypothetical protein [Candidatus Edwardsbacteria bacterium]
MADKGKRLPLLIVIVLGTVFVVQYFVPSRPSQGLYRQALRWSIVMGLPAIVIAIDSLVRHHAARIRRRQAGWGDSLVYLGAALLMAAAGLAGGVGEGSLFMRLFTYAMAPMQATVFSLLAFYMTSAAYRSFRARSAEATLLLASAFILMLGLIPLGAAIWRGIPAVSEWLLLVPNMAAKRGLGFGIGLGIVATALKIILGVERSWMGGS